MARSKGSIERRNGLLKSSLSVDVDNEGKLQIKCRPMFRRELKRYLRDISMVARELVDKRHSTPMPNYVHTGRLKRSIHPGPIKDLNGSRISGTVTAGSRLAKYARFVHEGTLPHLITAKPGKYLAFKWAGRTFERESITWSTDRRGIKRGTRTTETVELADRDVAVKQVKHPGYRGDRFLNQAAAIVVGAHGGKVNLIKRGQ